MEERGEVVTFRGKPVSLLGPEIKVGQRAPDFNLIDADLQEVALSQGRGKTRLLSVVYSVETPVCDLQTRTFEEQAIKFPNTLFYNISMDLPFTLARFRREHQIQIIKLLSDHREAAFGLAYGLLIKEARLLARAVLVVDPDGIVRYVEHVKEVTRAPDYETALAALKQVAGECLEG